ncbi:hypothetical protein K402DRAFT_459943 [Aulographum hederae CBS 113979]|uniref:Uncharacterized protein n=1 Tax=Aulographum hederae CBS 113979 TaxID=1176131 RepID=A0A6G1HDU4_9PEZI|nr:hypothetical protein K402DRAFT_459943 [Aulographum hederae CBS 113979]
MSRPWSKEDEENFMDFTDIDGPSDFIPYDKWDEVGPKYFTGQDGEPTWSSFKEWRLAKHNETSSSRPLPTADQFAKALMSMEWSSIEAVSNLEDIMNRLQPIALPPFWGENEDSPGEHQLRLLPCRCVIDHEESNEERGKDKRHMSKAGLGGFRIRKRRIFKWPIPSRERLRKFWQLGDVQILSEEGYWEYAHFVLVMSFHKVIDRDKPDAEPKHPVFLVYNWVQDFYGDCEDRKAIDTRINATSEELLGGKFCDATKEPFTYSALENDLQSVPHPNDLLELRSE